MFLTKVHTLLITGLYLLSAPLLAGNLEYNLSSALEQGDLQYFKELIKQGAQVNQKQEPFQQTPIIIAPLKGLAFVKVLLENGADINSRDQDNTTALINACLYGELEIAKLLISRGADINAVNNDDLNVLEAARLSKNQALIDYIQTRLK